MFNYDGQTYEDGDTVHDLGTFVCTEVKQDQTTGDKQVRGYMGKSADISKLPTYESLSTGSWAMCTDTGSVLFYEASTKTWA